MTDKGAFKKIEIERKASNVVITIRCADEYSAMLIYDHLADELATGRLELKVTVNPPATSLPSQHETKGGS